MIIEMARVRVLGPRSLLGATVHVLQDKGVVHLVDAAPIGGLRRHEVEPIARRRRRHVARALADVERAIAGLVFLGCQVADSDGPAPPDAKVAWLAARLAATVDKLRARQRRLVEERDALRAYEPLFAELAELARDGRRSVFVLTPRTATATETLRDALAQLLGDSGELRDRALAGGDRVVLASVPLERAAAIENRLADARIERAALPPALASDPSRMAERLSAVELDLRLVGDEATAIARQHGEDLARARRAFHDQLLASAAEDRAAISTRAFVLEGWLPMREVGELSHALATTVGPQLAVETVAREDWRGEDAPVVLSNPRLFAPFELVTSLLPLPRYGTVDPTPFVAVFFPMLFGVVVGDIGYGLVIALIAIALRLAGPRRRNLAKIAGALAAYTVIFGVLYGELFGDLGTRWFGMSALWFDRREAVLAFLVLAIALGLAHLVIGLVVAALSRWRRAPREAIGRGLIALMLVLVAIALLALFEQVPAVLLAPSAIALLVAFPIVIVLEGATAVLDIMTIFGHVLSYARVMALGTASVMLAVVANQMHGAFGSVAVGIAFALVFHIVNFAITLFSPTIQVLRLHYVEFFGTFFEPGGGPYQPLRHWSPAGAS